jgi:hypothetical protein
MLQFGHVLNSTKLSWVTKIAIITQGLPMGENLSKLLTSGEHIFQKSPNETNNSL